MYKLVFDDKAIEQLEKFPKLVRKRVFNKLQSSKGNPRRFFERLEGRPEYKLRVGDYRVIADIIDEKIMILVLYVGHRKKIYKIESFD